ncbi:MAG TPA: ferredoxin [Acidimicrobiales bacterium]|jgi:ferredoxin|nr:ferredoxin [Acidimicrobiales bacterium]
MASRIFADREKCVGAGTCVTIAPTVFDQGDDDAIILLLQEDIADEDLAAVEQAIEACPARAIWLER